MDAVEALRDQLISYIKKKFYTRQNILDIADEIVNQAFLDVMKSPSFCNGQLNFGYMSTVCIRRAYKVFHQTDSHKDTVLSLELTIPLISEDNFVDELEKAEDTAALLQSLQTLKQIEQLIINERYYGSFSFREISERHGININTILSHHRRALDKLRPILSPFFDSY